MTVLKNRLTILLSLFSITVVFGQDTLFKGIPQDKSSYEKLNQLFDDYEVVSMSTESLVNYVTDKKDDFLLGLFFSRDLSFGGLRMYANDIRSEDYIVRTIAESGESIVANNNSDNISFTGFNNGTERVVLSITNNFIAGFIEDKGKKYFIEPLRHIIDGAGVDLYAIYKESDVIPVRSNKCIAIQMEESKDDLIYKSNKVLPNCYKVRIAVANDYAMYTRYGSNLQELENINITIINGAELQFDDEFNYDIEFELVEQYISQCSTCDPWQTNTNSGETQLNYFKDWGNDNGFSNDFDLATLWSNRSFEQFTYGWAFKFGLNTNTLGYSLRIISGSSVEGIIGLAVHEFGHNFGASHNSSSCNMNNAFASCWTSQNQTSMNSTIRKAIDNRRIDTCIDCDNGYIVLDSTGLNCPTDPFQVCGVFGNPSCLNFTPALSLRLFTSSGSFPVNTLTNAVIDVVNGTFCFTVSPSDFGVQPLGIYEFEVTSFYEDEFTPITIVDDGANEGPDIIFNSCASPCPSAGNDVSIAFCNDDITYNLFNYLDDANLGGFWEQSFNGYNFNPSLDGNLGFITATYTIPASDDCDGDSATITIAVSDCTDTGGYDNGNWYFGQKAGLSFNGNTTSALINGQTPQQYECTATASDANGNLLFYTNGNTVWNKNHDIMEGGDNSIMATNGNDQSVVILPIPNSNKYYIFTEKATSPNGNGSFNSTYYFSIVNLDTNRGLGSIESINTELFDTSFIVEQDGDFMWFQYAYHHNMTTALHADGENYWLILHPSNAFVAFHITETILSTLPEYTLSTNGDFNNNLDCSTIKEYSLKASPRGDKLAYVGSNFGCLGFSELYIHNFDNESGLLTGYPTTLNENLLIPYYTSVEFSSSGDILYGDYRKVGGNYEIHAYDLTTIGTDPLILDSGIENTDPYSHTGNFIQRAVDGRIYSTIGSSSTLISTLTNINYIDNVHLTEDAIDLTRAKDEFPQAVPLHGFSYMRCAPTVVVTRDVSDRHVDIQSAQNTIVLKHHIKAGAVAEYRAGSEVILGANFQIDDDSQFKSFIEVCQ